MIILYETKFVVLVKDAYISDIQDIIKQKPKLKLVLNTSAIDLYLPTKFIDILKRYSRTIPIYARLERISSSDTYIPYLCLYPINAGVRDIGHCFYSASIGNSYILKDEGLKILERELLINILCNSCKYSNNKIRICAVNPLKTLINNTCMDYEAKI